MREDIRTDTNANKENSFYDVFKKRTYKDTQRYNIIAGIVITLKKYHLKNRKAVGNQSLSLYHF